MKMSKEIIADCILSDMESFWRKKIEDKEIAARVEEKVFDEWQDAVQLANMERWDELILHAERCGWDYTDECSEDEEEPEEEEEQDAPAPICNPMFKEPLELI